MQKIHKKNAKNRFIRKSSQLKVLNLIWGRCDNPILNTSGCVSPKQPEQTLIYFCSLSGRYTVAVTFTMETGEKVHFSVWDIV